MARILLADDYPDIRKVLALLLGQYGHEIIEAGNGQEAIDFAKQQAPDLILMDMSMPVLSGWDATRMIKADPATALIPIIALTAHAMKGDRERTWEAGCDAIITKPIDDELLQHTIEQVISEKREARPAGELAPEDVAVAQSPRRQTGKLISIHNQHILIADSDPVATGLISNELKARGYRTSVAEDATQALALIESEAPDLIICDVDLRGADGYELTEQIKKNPRLPFIPVILITEENVDWDRALEVGADDFLAKPINKAKMLVRVRSLIRLKSALDSEANRANELASVLSQIANGLMIIDNEATVTVINGSGLEILSTSLDEVIGVKIEQMINRLNLRDADCMPIAPEEFPLTRALSHGETITRRLLCLSKRREADTILKFNAAPIYNEHGHKIGAVSIFEDVTEEERARQQSAEQTKRVETGKA